MAFYQITSYSNCINIMSLTLFMPFYLEVMRWNSIPYTWVFFIIFIFYSRSKNKLRNLKISRNFFITLIIVFALIRISSDIQWLRQFSDYNIPKLIFRNVNLIVYLVYFYYVFTRVEYKEISRLFNNIILYCLLYSISIFYFTITDYQSFLYSSFAKGVEYSILWSSSMFMHKQAWGPFFVLVVIVLIFRIFISGTNRYFYFICLISSIITVTLSLSRLAYISISLIFLVMLFYVKSKIKYTLIFITFIGVLILLKPQFLINRMESVYSALFLRKSISELQNVSSSHLSDYALQQYLDNLTIIPNSLLSSEFEYNLSEGFWNGILYQSGLIGLTIIIILYIKIYRLNIKLIRSGNESLKYLGRLGITILYLSFCQNIIVRDSFIVNYYGLILPYGFIWLYLIYWGELSYSIFQSTKKMEIS